MSKNNALDGYMPDNDNVVFEDDKQSNAADKIYPTCRFCGSTRLPTEKYPNQETANEAATMACDCYEARQYQDQKDKERKREENIVKLRQALSDFAQYCDAREIEIKEGLFDYLMTSGIGVLDNLIGSLSVTYYKVKIKINTNGKGNIVICFTYSDGGKIEVA